MSDDHMADLAEEYFEAWPISEDKLYQEEVEHDLFMNWQGNGED